MRKPSTPPYMTLVDEIGDFCPEPFFIRPHYLRIKKIDPNAPDGE